MGTKDSSSSSLDGSELQKVIGRAAELQRDAAERAPVGSSLDEVKEIARELDIDTPFIEQALDEREEALERERAEAFERERRRPTGVPSHPSEGMASPSPPLEARVESPWSDTERACWRRVTLGVLVIAASSSIAACVLAVRSLHAPATAAPWATSPTQPAPVDPPRTATPTPVPTAPPKASDTAVPAPSASAAEPPPPPVPSTYPPVPEEPAVPPPPEGEPASEATPPSVPGVPSAVAAPPSASGFLTLEALASSAARAIEARLRGTWELDGYSVLDRGAGTRFDVPPRPASPGERLETWWFREASRFEHAMRGGLSFSGKFGVTHRVTAARGIAVDAAEAPLFLLQGSAVRSSLGTSWEGEFYLARLASNDRRLILYALGRTIPSEPPPAQGARFVRR